MVKKYAFVLRGPYTDDEPETGGDNKSVRSAFLTENDALHATLNMCKNMITRHYQSRKWGQYKRFTNEYELVYTNSTEFPSVASYKPISRSFFKMWEVMHDFAGDMRVDARGGMQAMFLAEGPGGFMESFARFRATRCPGSSSEDRLHGMTLISKNKHIPNWKVPFADADGGGKGGGGGRGFKIHRGADGTGNLYNLDNIDHLVRSVGGEHSCHLVTADGGFDFSANFNGQEVSSLRLVVAEVYTALRLQAKGGCFLLKIYDIHAPATLRLLYAVWTCYASMRIVKPMTSRPANSEKYVLCCGFNGATPSLLAALRMSCASGCGKVTLKDVPTMFVKDVVHFNTHYIARQVCYICQTLSMIAGIVESDTHGVRLQLRNAILWCDRYGIPVSKEAIDRYTTLKGQQHPENDGEAREDEEGEEEGEEEVAAGRAAEEEAEEEAEGSSHTES